MGFRTSVLFSSKLAQKLERWEEWIFLSSLSQQPSLTPLFFLSWRQVLPQALITRRNARAIPRHSASKVLSSLNNNCTLSLSGSLFIHVAWAKPRPLTMTFMGWLGEWRAVFLLPPVPQMQVLPRSTWAGPGGSAPLVSYRQSWEVQWHWPAHAGCVSSPLFHSYKPFSFSFFFVVPRSHIPHGNHRNIHKYGRVFACHFFFVCLENGGACSSLLVFLVIAVELIVSCWDFWD